MKITRKMLAVKDSLQQQLHADENSCDSIVMMEQSTSDQPMAVVFNANSEEVMLESVAAPSSSAGGGNVILVVGCGSGGGAGPAPTTPGCCEFGYGSVSSSDDEMISDDGSGGGCGGEADLINGTLTGTAAAAAETVVAGNEPPLANRQLLLGGSELAGMESSSPSPPSTPSVLLTVARKVNSFYLNGLVNQCIPWVVDNSRVGLIMPNVLEQLLKDQNNAGFPFLIREDFMEFNPKVVGSTYEERSKAVDQLLRDWKERGCFSALKGWRNEAFEVACNFDALSLFKMERSATFLFGIRKYGVDINGYVDHPIHGICIWLQKRSVTKPTWPNMWDNLVGGGLSSGYTILDTAIKEAGEEANIPPEILRANLKPIGTVSIFFNNQRGLSPNTEFVFDLELPLDFHPKNTDGEVDEFNLVTVEEALRICCGPDFKTTSCPVIIDFMIRHGLINEQSEPNLMEVKKLFNVPLEIFYFKE